MPALPRRRQRFAPPSPRGTRRGRARCWRPDTRGLLEYQQAQPCAQALRERSLATGAVQGEQERGPERETERVVADTWFLTRTGQGWRVARPAVSPTARPAVPSSTCSGCFSAAHPSPNPSTSWAPSPTGISGWAGTPRTDPGLGESGRLACRGLLPVAGHPDGDRLPAVLAGPIGGRAGRLQQTQLAQREDAVDWAAYVGSADFWNRTLQNWQSELLAVGSFAVLAVFLRQRGSPESKPVGADQRRRRHQRLAHDDRDLG
jgi:uncharacterized protein DUF6766